MKYSFYIFITIYYKKFKVRVMSKVELLNKNIISNVYIYVLDLPDIGRKNVLLFFYSRRNFQQLTAEDWPSIIF